MREINKVIVHCLDTPDYPLSNVERDFSIIDVRKWHVEEREFNDVGYHAVIKRGGTIEFGRKASKAGAHCRGENADSLGVAYAGRERPTWPQVQSLVSLYKQYEADFEIGPDSWFGHNEFNTNKTCPGFSIEMLRMFFRTCELG